MNVSLISLDNCHISVSGTALKLSDTFECGQCFRWNAEGKGYSGIVNGVAVNAEQLEDGFLLTGEGIGAIPDFWREYFDLDTDYDAIGTSFEKDSYLYKASLAGRGIHILRQDPWEVLVSFIISANNNITRIKKIIEKLCELRGTPIKSNNKTYYAFPTPEQVKDITDEEIALLHAGYRDRYLAAAFRQEGESFSADSMKALNNTHLRKALLSILGIGNKVCDCVMLFGYTRYSAFPKDVWIKRVISEHLGEGFSEESLGEYAGVIQQYLFNYARNVEKQPVDNNSRM